MGWVDPWLGWVNIFSVFGGYAAYRKSTYDDCNYTVHTPFQKFCWLCILFFVNGRPSGDREPCSLTCLNPLPLGRYDYDYDCSR